MPLSLLMYPLELDLGKTSKVANETSHQSNTMTNGQSNTMVDK